MCNWRLKSHIIVACFTYIGKLKGNMMKNCLNQEKIDNLNKFMARNEIELIIV